MSDRQGQGSAQGFSTFITLPPGGIPGLVLPGTSTASAAASSSSAAAPEAAQAGSSSAASDEAQAQQEWASGVEAEASSSRGNPSPAQASSSAAPAPAPATATAPSTSRAQGQHDGDAQMSEAPASSSSAAAGAMVSAEAPTAAAAASLSSTFSLRAGHAAVQRAMELVEQERQAKVEAEKEAEKKAREQGEEALARIYESLDFDLLWKKLSDALDRLKGDANAAQILLPMIESLMVVSKHVATSESSEAPSSSVTASLRGSLSPMTEHAPPTPQAPRSTREAMSQSFFSFTERHRKILNVMVRQNPSLMSGSFALLVHNPKVLDFDNKRNYFTQQLHKGRREHYTPLSLSVRRQYVFADSFHFFTRHSGPEIKHGKLNVRFYNEEGIDAGGVTREWFQVLARAMFNPDYALFAPCAADRTTYQPNRASAVNPDHLAYFTFIGRVIGKAIYDGRLLDAYFTRSFYKHILGKAVDYRDLESIDPEYFKSLEWMLQNDITDILDLNFSVEADEFGETMTIELKENGANIAVTEQNKQEYVRLVTEQRLTLSIRKQIDAFLQGFHEIIPQSLVRIFSETELELLISGLPDIDVDAWKNNTELHGYSSSDAVIQWWWRAVRSFDQTQKAKLLQFITGTSKVPLEGFGHLQGVQGTQRFNIHRAYGSDRLPAAHTCFNQLDLPQYESYEKLRSQLLLAMNEGGEGFGFA